MRPKRWQLHDRLRWWLIDRLVGRRACAFNMKFDPKDNA